MKRGSLSNFEATATGGSTARRRPAIDGHARMVSLLDQRDAAALSLWGRERRHPRRGRAQPVVRDSGEFADVLGR